MPLIPVWSYVWNKFHSVKKFLKFNFSEFSVLKKSFSFDVEAFPAKNRIDIISSQFILNPLLWHLLNRYPIYHYVRYFIWLITYDKKFLE